MTFTPNIPQVGQSLGNSRLQVLNNFAILRSTNNTNHFDVNETGNGKHRYVEMPLRTVVPPFLLAGEGTLYTKAGPNNTDLFYTADNGGKQYQMTRTKDADFATFGTFTNYPPAVANQFGGWTFLPGGLIFQYGQMTTTGNLTPIVFPIPFTAVFTAVATKEQGNVTGKFWGIINLTPAGFDFTVVAPVSPTQFYWTAIGN